MNKDQATKRPWKVGEIHGKRIKELWIHAEGYTCPVAYCNATNGIEAKAEANAQLIVKAVNEYDNLKEGIDRRTIEIARQQAIIDELVEALKAAEQSIYKNAENGGHALQALRIIQQALKKAE